MGAVQRLSQTGKRSTPPGSNVKKVMISVPVVALEEMNSASDELQVSRSLLLTTAARFLMSERDLATKKGFFTEPRN